jgi:hypothetical protein
MGASRDFADKTDRSTVFRPSQELMGHVYDEFERTLEAWRVKYAGQPRPIPQDVRTLIHHALVWAWKDEEMHAIYIRGAIGDWQRGTRLV